MKLTEPACPAGGRTALAVPRSRPSPHSSRGGRTMPDDASSGKNTSPQENRKKES
jgi:hypothetical protein